MFFDSLDSDGGFGTRVSSATVVSAFFAKRTGIGTAGAEPAQQMTKAHGQTVVGYEFERTFFTGVAWLVSRKRLKRSVRFVKRI